jgi:phage protein U
LVSFLNENIIEYLFDLSQILVQRLQSKEMGKWQRNRWTNARPSRQLVQQEREKEEAEIFEKQHFP